MGIAIANRKNRCDFGALRCFLCVPLWRRGIWWGIQGYPNMKSGAPRDELKNGRVFAWIVPEPVSCKKYRLNFALGDYGHIKKLENEKTARSFLHIVFVRPLGWWTSALLGQGRLLKQKPYFHALLAMQWKFLGRDVRPDIRPLVRGTSRPKTLCLGCFSVLTWWSFSTFWHISCHCWRASGNCSTFSFGDEVGQSLGGSHELLESPPEFPESSPNVPGSFPATSREALSIWT